MNRYEKEAIDNFLAGYNCAQSVLMAFAEDCGMERDYAARLASSMGGGFGGLREMCGAVSGMSMVLGVLYGYNEPKNPTVKKAHYQRVNRLISKFKEMNGSYLCGDLLGIKGSTDPQPAPRTEEYYKHRPCAKFCGDCARLVSEYMEGNPI